ncbi:hypothetical protein CL628_03990 [bacterium]|nr:hypothetical protein [bacterium]
MICFDVYVLGKVIGQVRSNVAKLAWELAQVEYPGCAIKRAQYRPWRIINGRFVTDAAMRGHEAACQAYGGWVPPWWARR